MFGTPWIAALSALFLWWFSTGAILCVVKYGENGRADAVRRMTWWSLPLGLVGCGMLVWSAFSITVASVYLAFVGALLVWGWIELAFLAGVITGPNLNPCPPEVPEWERFVRAWGTLAFHEMMLLAVLFALLALGNAAPNDFGVWTFAVLYFARVSAKLNLFMGVPRIHTDFLPNALAHLPSHFRIKSLNWLFPIAITGLSCATAYWGFHLYAALAPFETVGFALLTAITALALLEHWLMVLPVPDDKLWRWMLPQPSPNTPLDPRTAP